MTWSIVARDADGSFGVAIASRFLAVGALCVHTRRAVGALSTQALMNPLYGPAGIDLLADGVAPEEVVARLTDADEGRAQRQLHVIGARGRAAAYTGKQCLDGCGHRVHEDFSVAGNMLAGTDVLDATVAAYAAGAGLPLAERLIAAMEAGERAGGDKRGKQAAALRIHGDEDYPSLDLRVDDHEEPLGRAAPPVREEPRAPPAFHRLPARPPRSGRPAPSRRDRAPRRGVRRRAPGRPWWPGPCVMSAPLLLRIDCPEVSR